LAVAEIVFPCATVELKLVVNTPLPFEDPEDGVSVLPVPLEDGMTVAPLMTLLNGSRTVTVMVDAVEPATHAAEQAVIDAVPAVRDDCDALTPAGFTVTAAVCVIAPPPNPVVAVAEIVLAWATVELSLAAYTPLAFDEPLAAGLNALPVPVELSVTVAPLTGLLNWSRTVTVTLSAVPAATVQPTEQAMTVATLSTTPDWLALGASAVPVAENDAPGVPAEAAETVLVPAPVPSVQAVSCANPLPSVDNPAGEDGDELPPPDVTVNVTPAL
jgi:hypothetical protein